MTVDSVVYESLRKLRPPSPIFIQAEDEKIQHLVLEVLGYGGSKRAYALEGGMALLLPNTLVLNNSSRSVLWSRMVEEELTATRRVRELGLFACNLEKVQVFMTTESSTSIPAYRTETFSQLSKKGIWIIDNKNPTSSTWDKSLFKDGVDRFDEKNWEPILSPFLVDIAKLITNNFLLHDDNVNIAIVEDEGKSYKIRYFGFDFSSRYEELSFKSIGPEHLRSMISFVISSSLWSIFYVEFRGADLDRQDALKRSLRASCIKKLSAALSLPEAS